MSAFVTRPVAVDAVQWDGVPEHAPDAVCFQAYCSEWVTGGHIHTLEGQMAVHTGDYVIRAANGDFSACPPDLFAQTYEPVE